MQSGMKIVMEKWQSMATHWNDITSNRPEFITTDMAYKFINQASLAGMYIENFIKLENSQSG